jgi:hypothetical protein
MARAFCLALSLAALAALSACASTPAPAPAVGPVALVHGEPAIPLLGALVRAHNQAGQVPSAAAVRAVVVEFARDAGVVVVDEGGAAVVGSGALWFVVRHSDLPDCVDADAGVVAGEPPRVVGCGALDLAGVAAFAVAAVHAPTRARFALVDDDDALARLLAGAPKKTVWTTGGLINSGVDADVLDVVAVDAGAVEVGLAAADVDALVAAAGRVVTWRPPPRLPAVAAERRALLAPAALASVTSSFASAWAAIAGEAAPLDDAMRDRCTVASLTPRLDATRDDPSSWSSAVVRCAAMPGRVVDDVVDDVVGAVADPRVRIGVRSTVAPSATTLRLPAIAALTAAVTSTSPRVLVAPQLDGAVRAAPSVCTRARQAGAPCFGALPLLLHPLDVGRRGKRDESVPVDALAAATAVVVATVTSPGVLP